MGKVVQDEMELMEQLGLEWDAFSGGMGNEGVSVNQRQPKKRQCCFKVEPAYNACRGYAAPNRDARETPRPGLREASRVPRVSSKAERRLTGEVLGLLGFNWRLLGVTGGPRGAGHATRCLSLLGLNPSDTPKLACSHKD